MLIKYKWTCLRIQNIQSIIYYHTKLIHTKYTNTVDECTEAGRNRNALASVFTRAKVYIVSCANGELVYSSEREDENRSMDFRASRGASGRGTGASQLGKPSHRPSSSSPYSLLLLMPRPAAPPLVVPPAAAAAAWLLLRLLTPIASGLLQQATPRRRRHRRSILPVPTP